MTYVLSGRRIVYTNMIPYETDILASNNYHMVASSALAQTIIGTGISNTTTVRDLACTPISPPGMSVIIGPGVMYSFEDYDATAFGVIPADTDPLHKLYKQAFLWGNLTIPLTAPPTSGDSIIYLIEAIFDTEDVNNVNREYFNSADPTSPIFNTNYDTRTDKIIIQAIAGTPSVSPVAPTPTAGYTGLYYVTIANGQTTIISGDIEKVSTVEGHPFITEGLTDKISSATVADGFVSIPAQQANSYVYANDVGSVNTVEANPAKAYAAYVPGMSIDILIAHSNTGAATLEVSGNGAADIVTATKQAGLQHLIGGELVQGGIYTFKYNGTEWELKDPSLLFKYGEVTFQAATTQAIPGTTAAAIRFNDVLSDSESWWDATLHAFKPNVSGWYEVNGSCFANGAGGLSLLQIYKNGVLVKNLGGFVFDSPNQTDTNLCGSCHIQLNGTTDYVSLTWNNTNPSTVTLSSDHSFFQITYLAR